MTEKKATLLIVDDMPTNIQTLSIIFQDRYIIKVATNGKKALEIAASDEKPNLILLDIVMPQMDGYEVCKRLKADPQTAAIPVIFVTAKGEAEDEEEGFRLGAVDYVTKPFRPSTILSRVQTHLKLSEHEARLKEFNQKLEEQVEAELLMRLGAQRQYRTLFESSPISIIIYSMVGSSLGQIEEVNSAAQKLTGYTDDELLAMNPASLHKPDMKETIELYLKKISDGESISLEIECVKKDGSIVPVMVCAVPYWLGKDLKVYSYWMDLSEIKKIEAEKIFKDRLLVQQSKLATMGEMIGAIGHQWRQPLNSLGIVIQDVEYAFKYGELDEAYIKEYKTKAMDTIRYMSKTIDDFKNFFSPNKKEELFVVEDALSQAVTMFGAQLRNNDIEIFFDRNNETKHQYFCNKNELSQVILNILANAKDVLVERKPAKKFIKIDVQDEGDDLTLSFEDSAGGIPPEIMEKIFDSYFTTKDATGGTGIGLYMSKTIIEEHLGGKLSVQNAEHGAKFVIRLKKH